MPAYKPTFAKLVASPTTSSWAQAYNAGNLFAVLSLTTDTTSDEPDLKVLGKNVFSTLQAEFFPLEEKTLAAITSAVEESIKELPNEIEISFCIAHQKDEILYVFIAGAGKILLKRDAKFGTILESEVKEKKVHTASGKLEDGDILILQTQQCTSIISVDSLRAGLEDNVEEAAEAFMPQVHGQDDGGAAALFIKFQVEAPTTEDESPYAFVSPEDEDEKEEEGKKQMQHEELPTKQVFDEHEREKPIVVPLDVKKDEHRESPLLPITTFISSLSHRFGKKRLILGTLAVLLAFFLIFSISSAQKQNQENKARTAFAAIYKDALQQYEEGEDLVGLNDSLAKEDFTKAQKTLEGGKAYISEGSDEEKQYNELQDKITAALGTGETGQEAKVSAADSADTPLLQTAITHKEALSVTQDKNIYYYVTSAAIFSDADTPKELVANDSDWENIGGFASYNGNLYLLDKKEGILKFVAGSGGYGKSSYFTDTAPDLTQAVSMAIDGSVWVLYKDGSIMKFTKGVADSFTVSGLLKPPTNPTAIFTQTDMANLYILDSGSGRVIVLTKGGNFETQYRSDTIKGATMLDISEVDKKAYFLKDGKLYSFPL